MNVENMRSSKGNKVANQFIITDDYGNTFFQSYKSIIAKKNIRGEVELDSDTWDYSVTTGKYRNEFLGEGIAATREKIASGEYQLVDLN
jgi:hypothetical protein